MNTAELFKSTSEILYESLVKKLKSDLFVSNEEFNKLTDTHKSLFAQKYGHFQAGFFCKGNVYQYVGTIRPVSSFTVPMRTEMVITLDTIPALTHRQYGSVFYAEPLSLDDINHYSLIPINELKAVNGKRYKDASFDGLFYTVNIDENFCVMVTSEYEGETDTLSYGYKNLMNNLSIWVEVI